jgi:thiamine-phosphate diphosphorylase
VLRAASVRLRDACRAAGVLYCVNDRLDVALAVDADAVHLGQDDLPLADAREVRSLAKADRMLIGYSTHNREQALPRRRAAPITSASARSFRRQQGQPRSGRGLEALAAVCAAVSIPVVAIGGIELEPCPRRARRRRRRRRDLGRGSRRRIRRPRDASSPPRSRAPARRFSARRRSSGSARAGLRSRTGSR